MAKDDYHVIVYQILSYLYTQLKKGAAVEASYISNDSPYYRINERYWEYISRNLCQEGYIDGIYVKVQRYTDGQSETQIYGLEECQITPKGIEYLSDNSFMNKAKEFFKDVKSIVPFV